MTKTLLGAQQQKPRLGCAVRSGRQCNLAAPRTEHRSTMSVDKTSAAKATGALYLHSLHTPIAQRTSLMHICHWNQIGRAQALKPKMVRVCVPSHTTTAQHTYMNAHDDLAPGRRVSKDATTLDVVDDPILFSGYLIKKKLKTGFK